jgi:iron complex transport system permease protein
VTSLVAVTSEAAGATRGPEGAGAVLAGARGRRRRASVRLVALLSVALAVTFVASLSLGSASASIADLGPWVLGNVDEQTGFVLGRLRLPRAVTGMLVGASFGLSGALFQSMVRNPLASPDVIGVTAAASAGAVVALALFEASAPVVAVSAVAGAGLGAALTYGLAYRRGRTSTVRIVLVGIGVAAGFNAVVAYALTRASIYSAAAAQAWLAGSLNGSDWGDVASVAAMAMLVAPLVAVAAWRLRAIELGDDVANLLGAGAERSRLSIVVAGVVLAGGATAVAGPVAFVAFVSAPIARQLARSSTALATSALVGATLVAGADLVGRVAFAPNELPVGVLTGVLGAPYLLWLLTRVGSISGR